MTGRLEPLAGDARATEVPGDTLSLDGGRHGEGVSGLGDHSGLVGRPAHPVEVSPQGVARLDGPERVARVLCPYLEVDGARWRHATASRDHRCTAVHPGAPLTIDKQRRLCLGAAHVTCPAYLTALAARRSWSGLATGASGAPRRSIPPEAFANRWGLTRTAPVVARPVRTGLPLASVRHQRVLAQAGLVGALLLAFGAIAISRFPGNDGGALLVPTPSPVPTPTLAPTPSVSPSPTVGITASPTIEPTSRPTATPQPTIAATTYRVVAGDTLSGIAARYRTTVKALMDLNKLTSTTLHIGQVLRIPPPST
jgi:LysM repeat protein